MSKQHRKPTISDRLRRGLAGILSLALLIGLLPAFIAPAEAAHWATPYVNTLVDWGVMRGDISGNMAPGRSITRAEFVAMMNRAYGYTRTEGHPFTDVRVRDWYNDDIDIGYNMGYFKGTSPTTASPNASLTREQAAVLLARNMMLQPTVGETLGFSDTRTLSDWSRGLVGAAAENGILGGYSDGSFKPRSNITRGEVAAMLVRAIGTPIQTEGDHTLGNVYGNVTVNTPGVRLRDGVITGNLYLTGGIDLGDVLMENLTVLGEIVVSGAGESNSSQSSIVLRNVTAEAMTVDSISDQFVTIRAEGNTDVKTTTVRTNAYVDDSSLPGYGLWKIIQDGGSLLQLAGNTKEVINKTPDSSLQVVQGVADKVTIDEKATGSSVLVDGDARVDELDLDVGATVTGEGDIKNLNVGAAGSTVEQMPDNITIRPGITADINGSEMNSSQAAEASSEPRLLAGYPRAKNVAPTTATLVFSANQPGTIYWAVSAVSDGSVSEADLIENPTYGGKIIQAGTIEAAASNTEYTAEVGDLAMDGSYYISAILVNSRDKRSPVKVTAFSTPDGAVPAFIGDPTATLRSVQTAQVTGMPNKSCQLYWALLPEGAAAPTPAEFKANAVRGNLGYGSIDVTKNVSQSINVNRSRLVEKTNYVAYLWLTDHDGAQSSQVYAVPIYIPDQTPPELGSMRQTANNANSVETSFTMNETGKLHWAIVTDQMHEDQSFISYDITTNCPTGVIGDPGPSTEATTAYLNIESEDAALAAKIAVTTGTGAGAIVSGSTDVTAANTLTRVLMAAATGLDPAVYNTSTFYMYYVGEDSETPGNLSKVVGVKEVNVLDETPPEFLEQKFDSYNTNDLVHPLADTSITLVFSEPIQSGSSRDRTNRFLVLYQAVQDAISALPEGADPEQSQAVQEAREALSEALHKSIKLYTGNETQPVISNEDRNGSSSPSEYILDYRYAQVERENGTGRMIITFPHNTGYTRPDAASPTGTAPIYGVNLKSGATYHFELTDIYDCAAPRPNALQYNASGHYNVPEFRTAVAEVSLKVLTPAPSIMRNASARAKPTDSGDRKIPFHAVVGTTNYGLVDDVTTTDGTEIPASWSSNPPQRIDRAFLVDALDSNSGDDAGDDIRYDILIWADTAMRVSLYSRPARGATEETPWDLVGTAEYSGTGTGAGAGGLVYRSLFRDFKGVWDYEKLSDMEDTEFAIHVDELYYNNAMNPDFFTWNKTVQVQVTVVAGSTLLLQQFVGGTQNKATYDSVLLQGASSIGVPDPLEGNTVNMVFTDRKAPDITKVSIINGDRFPDISVGLKGGGRVNYLFIPLTNLQYSSNGNLVPLPDSFAIRDTMITNGPESANPDDYYITRYDANPPVQLTQGVTPKISDIQGIREFGSYGTFTTLADGTVKYRDEVLLAAPSRYTVTDGYDIDGVVRGQTDPVPEGQDAKIDLVGKNTPLRPNTIYFLCLVPQGDSEDTVSNNVFGWRFTTQTATRPVITLNNGKGTDATHIDVTATVNTTAAVWSILVNQTMLFNTPMSGNMSERNVQPDKWDLFEAYMKENNYTSTTENGVTTYNYSIVDALKNSYTMDGLSPHGSVFDYFASTTLKEDVREFIEESNRAGVVEDRWNSGATIQGGRQTTVDYRSNTLDPDATYICFAMARTSVTDNTVEHGFRALVPVELLNTNPPKIRTINTGNLRYNETFGVTGSITVQFDTTLYVISSKNNRLMMLPQDDQDEINGEYCGMLGKLSDWPDTVSLRTDTIEAPRTSFTIDVESEMPGTGGGTGDPAPKSIAFTIPRLCSKGSREVYDLVTLTYNPDSPDAGPTGFVATFSGTYRADDYYVS